MIQKNNFELRIVAGDLTDHSQMQDAEINLQILHLMVQDQQLADNLVALDFTNIGKYRYLQYVIATNSVPPMEVI
jgi:hypothetical protein